eukprot:6936432-Lingulodinium_polyedra.AAC.1
MLAGLLTGVQSLVAKVLATPRASKYHLAGFQRLGPQAFKFVGLASIASYPSESFLLEIMEDDRVPSRLAALEATLYDELEWVCHIKGDVWELLGQACGMSGQLMRSLAINAAHTSVAYIDHKTLKVAKAAPWNLVQGDKAANLEGLQAAEEAPREPTSFRIWQLLQLGYNKQQLLEGLELLADCGWSTTSTEQQHGSASSMAKAHKGYSSETLVNRSMVHMMRQFCHRSPEDQTTEALQAKVQRLKEKKPIHISARQAYFQALSNLAQ